MSSPEVSASRTAAMARAVAETPRPSRLVANNASASARRRARRSPVRLASATARSLSIRASSGTRHRICQAGSNSSCAASLSREPRALAKSHLPRSAAGQLAMCDAVRTRGLRSQPLHLILFVALEVAFEPKPAGRILVGALPGEDVRGDAVQEPAVVRDHHGAAGELFEGVLQ